MSNLDLVLKQLGVEYETNVCLKDHTWIHRGGTADYYATPCNELELKELVSYLYKESIPFLIIGHSSNIYIKNSTNLGFVISTVKCNHYALEEDALFCESGVSVIRLANDMINRGVKGFECLTELPGTVGAALINNSSCKDNSISALLISATVLLSSGQIVVFSPEDFHFSYRSSAFKRLEVKGILLSVRLKVNKDSVERLRSIAINNRTDREKRLGPKSSNLGCVLDKPFSLGRMEIKYFLPFTILRGVSKVFHLSRERRNHLINKVLCSLSRCSAAFPYISNKNVLVFMWTDNGADTAFPIYLQYMEKVYKTNMLEIEIL